MVRERKDALEDDFDSSATKKTKLNPESKNVTRWFSTNSIEKYVGMHPILSDCNVDDKIINNIFIAVEFLERFEENRESDSGVVSSVQEFVP